jgi:hypothetical protein
MITVTLGTEVPGTIFLGKNDIANALGKIISPPLSFT